ncbi:MAG: NAD(P)/FAD-dependent oxidoreductase [Cyanobacteria bacterium P01_H01_bin.121]
MGNPGKVELHPDVIVIGSGIGGLSCGALLARYGLSVVVCESHSIAGGAAHAFQRQGFTFESGPSLYSGISYSPSPNPLRQVLDAIEEDLPCFNYDTWGCHLPEGDFDTQVGAEQFCDVLQTLRGSQAVQEWQNLQTLMEPYGKAATALPPAAMRWDLGAALTFMPFLGRLGWQLPHVFRLTGTFQQLIAGTIKDPFIQNWLDLLCFLLSGLPANGTSAAEMAFMFADWYRPNVTLDFPVGGSEAMVNVLVRGLEKYGGKLLLNHHVEQILLERDRAVGIRLRGGQVIKARQAVVSNASIWDTLPLLPSESNSHQSMFPSSRQRWQQERQQLQPCPSFMHLHLGIDGQGIPTDLACHHIIVQDWQRGVTASQNVVVCSIPSLLDASLAPAGKHAIHAYTPATEPYELWQGLKRGSNAYQEQKATRAEALWQALERVIPDIRDRCEVTLVGTPLTHAHYLRRYQGSYGPAIAADQALFPGANTPIKGLLCCGDSTFPGIGLPAVAASGMITANTIAPVHQHLNLLKKLALT